MKGLVFNNVEGLKEAISDNIHVVSISAAEKIDTAFGSGMDRIIVRLAEIFRTLNIVVNYSNKELSNIKFDSQMILWQGANSLIGALQLIRLGYFLEPNFLARHTVENLSIALTLLNKPDRYSDFISGKLTGEKCIGEAKKIISQIGQIYGQLSNATHPSKRWLGVYVANTRDTMLIGGGVVNEHMYRVKMNLAMLEFLATVYLSGVEIVFYDFIDDHKFWRKKGGELFEWQPSEEEKEYAEERNELFLEAVKEFEKISKR